MKKTAGVLIGILMMLVFASSANAAILLQQVQSTPYVVQVGGLSSEQAAQSIKESVNLVSLKNVSLKVYREGNPAADFKVEIQTSTVPTGDGSPSGTVLAYGSVVGSQITTNWPGAVYKIELNTAITLSANTEYWIVAKPTSLVDDTNHFRVFISVTDPQGPYANGKIKYYASSTWRSNFGQQYDFYFILESVDTPPPPPPVPLSLRLPFRSGETWYVTQGNNSTIQDCTHCSSFDPNLIYAWDFGTANAAGKAVLTPASGKVVEIYKDCPDNGSYCNGGWGNVVIINYGNNKYGKLAHLRTVSVKVGQYVFQGEQVGTCGATGDNYGPHIHYQTQNSPGLNDSSVPSSFVDPNVLSQNPDGIPSENSWYISSNTIPAAAYHLDTTFDTSGNNNNTTANPSCIVAGCLNLNSTSNYLEAPDSTSLSITGVNISIAGWLKTSSSSTQWIVSKYNNGASDASYGLYLSNGYVKFTVSPNGSTGGEVQSTVGVNNGNRRHVVVTYNGTDLTIYIDGTVNTWQSYVITNIFDSTSPLRIGAKNSQTAMEFFSEMLDELVVYDRTLTADEANNMYYSSKP